METHLRADWDCPRSSGKNGVGRDDLFLFYGLFRQIEFVNGSFSWAKGSLPLHTLWGWLQVGEIFRIDDLTTGYEWARYHPHFSGIRDANNTLYAAREYLTLDGSEIGNTPGAGIFPSLCGTRSLNFMAR